MVTRRQVSNQIKQRLRRPLRTRLFFNPTSGRNGDPELRLKTILAEFERQRIRCEVVRVRPDLDLAQESRRAVQSGIERIAVYGGDGTVDAVATGLIGLPAFLGILPGGTNNNIALSLGIPVDDLPAAVRLLRQGRLVRVDAGLVTCEQNNRYFLEGCSIGLASALFPSADDILHGNLARIGDLLATLVNFPPAEVHLHLDDRPPQSVSQAHVILVVNMPYIGAHFQFAPDVAPDDRFLDVFVFSETGKLDLLGVAVQAASSEVQDPRLQRYRVRRVRIQTRPPMPVNVDGWALGQGEVEVQICPRALTVLSGNRRHQPWLRRAWGQVKAWFTVKG